MGKGTEKHYVFFFVVEDGVNDKRNMFKGTYYRVYSSLMENEEN